MAQPSNAPGARAPGDACALVTYRERGAVIVNGRTLQTVFSLGEVGELLVRQSVAVVSSMLSGCEAGILDALAARPSELVLIGDGFFFQYVPRFRSGNHLLPIGNDSVGV